MTNIDDVKKALETLKETTSDYMNLAYLFCKTDVAIMESVYNQIFSLNAKIEAVKSDLVKYNFIKDSD